MKEEEVFPSIDEKELADTCKTRIYNLSDDPPTMWTSTPVQDDVCKIKNQMILFDKELDKMASNMEQMVDVVEMINENLKLLADNMKTQIEQTSIITDIMSDTNKMLAVEAVTLKTVLERVNQTKGRFTAILFVSLCTLFFTVVVFMGLRGGI